MSRAIVKPVGPEEWIELSPYGMVFGGEGARPLLIFKDDSGDVMVPVFLSPVDAGIAVSQKSTVKSDSSPHKLTFDVLKRLNIKIEACRFVEVKGYHQYVDLYFKGHPSLKCIRVRAEDAMSFCMTGKARFYSQKKFIRDCQDMEVDVNQFNPEQRMHPDLCKSTGPYIN